MAHQQMVQVTAMAPLARIDRGILSGRCEQRSNAYLWPTASKDLVLPHSPAQFSFPHSVTMSIRALIVPPPNPYMKVIKKWTVGC